MNLNDNIEFFFENNLLQENEDREWLQVGRGVRKYLKLNPPRKVKGLSLCHKHLPDSISQISVIKSELGIFCWLKGGSKERDESDAVITF